MQTKEPNGKITQQRLNEAPKESKVIITEGFDAQNKRVYGNTKAYTEQRKYKDIPKECVRVVIIVAGEKIQGPVGFIEECEAITKKKNK